MSTTQLTPSEESILSKGLNFVVVPKSIPIPHIVATVEDSLRRARVSGDTADRIRTKVVGVLSRAKLPPSNISLVERKAIRSIRKNESVVVLPADKGRSTIVMDRCDYEGKMMEMLNDETTYRQLNKDPMPSQERNMKSMLFKLRQADKLSDVLYSRLYSSTGLIPCVYGLPKVHKTEYHLDQLFPSFHPLRINCQSTYVPCSRP